MKYFIYARKSTNSEERQVLSIEAQLAELKEFAAKEKLEIVASLCEAKTAKEPEKISARTLFWAKAGFFLSLTCKNLLAFIIFVSIIMKEENINNFMIAKYGK
ncbi:MAG: Recombinase [Desulfonauticus sp. 38_4375]|nr:MAG: Recombinase [Desulfonauticus sp. 38_4375]